MSILLVTFAFYVRIVIGTKIVIGADVVFGANAAQQRMASSHGVPAVCRAWPARSWA